MAGPLFLATEGLKWEWCRGQRRYRHHVVQQGGDNQENLKINKKFIPHPVFCQRE